MCGSPRIRMLGERFDVSFLLLFLFCVISSEPGDDTACGEGARVVCFPSVV